MSKPVAVNHLDWECDYCTEPAEWLGAGGVRACDTHKSKAVR